ncbi:carboxypeptidase regulatory-like domain-containing protein [Aliidongia dinghuensis]|nr:carboxypeptidase regulatory-like domain-containing protein [Aliidongia dinghuensis]
MNKDFGPVFLGLLILALMLAASPASAARVLARIADDHGKPVADAVVSLVPKDGAALPETPAPPALVSTIIDQRDETFVPYVVAVEKGGTVVFRNSDKTQHHVYSFSPVKQFEFMLSPGESSAPVVFDTVGIAAIGCNIHDFMTAFVYVADTPFVAQSDHDGRAEIADLPPGTYSVRIWHPLVRPSAKPPVQTLTVAAAGAELSATLALVAPPRRDLEHGLY